MALLAAAAWAALIIQALRAGGPDPFMAALCQPAQGQPEPGWTGFFADWGRAFGFWGLMSVAMMLPTAVPMLASYREAADRAALKERKRAPATLLVAAGYLSIWLGVAAAAALLQTGMSRVAEGGSLPPALSAIAAGALVGLAGLYQFSAWKLRCLSFCRHEIAPADVSPRRSGAFALGWRQGLNCLGCCGAVMGLMLVAGSMNLFWMAGFALLMTLEKLTDGLWASRLIGGLLLAGGFAIAAAPLGLAPVLEGFARLVAGGRS